MTIKRKLCEILERFASKVEPYELNIITQSAQEA